MGFPFFGEMEKKADTICLEAAYSEWYYKFLLKEIQNHAQGEMLPGLFPV